MQLGRVTLSVREGGFLVPGKTGHFAVVKECANPQNSLEEKLEVRFY